MHGYKWPINCTRTRIPLGRVRTETDGVAQVVLEEGGAVAAQRKARQDRVAAMASTASGACAMNTVCFHIIRNLETMHD